MNPNYEDASPRFAYLVLRNACRPNVTSPDYLPNLLGTLDRDGNADSSRSGGKKFLRHIVTCSYTYSLCYLFIFLIKYFFYLKVKYLKII